MKITNKKNKILEEFELKKLSRQEIAKKFNTSKNYVNKVISRSRNLYDVKNQLIRYRKTIQKLRDQQRIEKKIKNVDIRKSNSYDMYLFEISKKIKSYKLPDLKKRKINNISNEYEGIFQLSDLHFNEIVSDLEENVYDFDVASKRLKKYVIEATNIFKSYKIKKILIMMTGDILGSDRRQDEKLNLATNRSIATIIGAFLIEQVIRDLNYNFDIKISMVCGNESRVFEIGDTNIIMEDNYDFVLYHMLKMIFKNNLDIFIDGNPYRKIIKIKDKNILFFHGHCMKKNNLESEILKLKGQIASINNITIDYMIFGHIHQCQIADFYARSASLCGGNSYSLNNLHLISKASQNIHIISKKFINSIKIDLQNFDDIDGYQISNQFLVKKSQKDQSKKLIYNF